MFPTNEKGLLFSMTTPIECHQFKPTPNDRVSLPDCKAMHNSAWFTNVRNVSLVQNLASISTLDPVWIRISKFLSKLGFMGGARFLQHLIQNSRTDVDFLMQLRSKYGFVKHSPERNQRCLLVQFQLQLQVQVRLQSASGSASVSASGSASVSASGSASVSASGSASRSGSAETLGSGSGVRAVYRIRDIQSELDRLRNDGGVPVAEMKYLDVGCSEGQITSSVVEYLNLKANRSFGIDIKAACCPSPYDGSTFQFQTYDGRNVPFPDDTFDLVTVFMAAHHFSDFEATLSSVRKVLKRSGTLIVREHDVQSKAMGVFLDLVHALYMTVVGDEMQPAEFANLYSRGEFARYQSLNDWVTLFAAHGFTCQRKIDTGDMFNSGYLVF